MRRYSYKSILCPVSIGSECTEYREKRRKGDCGEYEYSEYEYSQYEYRVIATIIMIQVEVVG